jgi:transcriptional regulator with XRE-family HTH domain
VLTAAENAAHARACRALGDRLCDLRTARGLSVGAAAAALGVSRNTVCNWESGRTGPTAAQVLALAAALGMTPGEVLDPVAAALRREGGGA